ncbi:hypothetical protein BH18ACT17_BH18ACT17_08460 [soil metagenome]
MDERWVVRATAAALVDMIAVAQARGDAVGMAALHRRAVVVAEGFGPPKAWKVNDPEQAQIDVEHATWIEFVPGLLLGPQLGALASSLAASPSSRLEAPIVDPWSRLNPTAWKALEQVSIRDVHSRLARSALPEPPVRGHRKVGLPA